MLISELEKTTGVTRHTSRFYEKEGLLDKRYIRRGANHYRCYSEEAVEHLTMLKAGQAAGFTLGELKELIKADEANELPVQRKVERIRQKMRDIERKKAELDRIQSYLAQILASKLTLQHATENGPACCESGTVSEVDTLPLPERNGSQPRLKGR